jgi:hypothetical protein
MECEEELIIDVSRTKRVKLVHADRRGREGISEKRIIHRSDRCSLHRVQSHSLRKNKISAMVSPSSRRLRGEELQTKAMRGGRMRERDLCGEKSSLGSQQIPSPWPQIQLSCRGSGAGCTCKSPPPPDSVQQPWGQRRRQRSGESNLPEEFG